MPRTSRRCLACLAVIGAAAAFHLFVAGHRLAMPGLYYDEVIFVNAALGGVGDSFVAQRVFGIPVQIMPYIGAVKSWIYAPVFALFGVDPWTIRWPVVLIGLLTVAVFARLAGVLHGTVFAAGTFLLLATDPAFLTMTRTDFGPIAVMDLCKAVALLSFFRWLRGGATPWLWVGLAALDIGFWDKLNFAWFLAAFAVAALLCHGRSILRHLRRLRTGERWLFAGFLLFAGATAALLVAQSDHPPVAGIPPGLGRVRHFLALFAETFDGSWMTSFHFAGVERQGSSALLLPLSAAILLPFGCLLAPPGRRLPNLRTAMFFLVCGVLVLVLIVLTPQSGGAHHMMVLWPLPQLFAIAVAAMTMAHAQSRLRALLATVWILIALFVIGTQVRECLEYRSRLDRPEIMTVPWNPGIYELAQEVEALRPTQTISADWGTFAQLFSLAPEDRRSRYVDRWPRFRELEPGSAADRYLLRTAGAGRVVYVLPAEEAQALPPCRANALTFLERHFPGRDVHRIPDRTGRPLYELHVVTR